jgi:hypothetical protein
MTKILSRAAGLAALLVAVAAPAASAHYNSSSSLSLELLSLDTHETANDGAAGPVSTSKPLKTGKKYALLVRGSFSAFAASQWESTTPGSPGACGIPEAAPIYPSPGQTNGKVGQDAETQYAKVFRLPCPPPIDRFPFHAMDFQMQLNTGSGYTHTEPLGGPFSVPNPYHLYVYFLTGQGQPLKVQLLDSSTSDNYGVFKMLVIGTGSECDWGGWKSFGKFKTEHDCDDYFDHD